MYALSTYYESILSDTLTPVSIYLKLRDRYPNSILLESSDYHAGDKSFSYICCNPIASIQVEHGRVTQVFPDGTQTIESTSNKPLTEQLESFLHTFQTEKLPLSFAYNGLFGYTGYDCVSYFEKMDAHPNRNASIPDMYYALYQNVIAIDHFKNQAWIFCHTPQSHHNLDEIIQLINIKNFPSYPFQALGEPVSNSTDAAFAALVGKAKEHCQRGDVFQLVLSRKFKQRFQGDEFNVYRALRNINPSPYLFYFDYGTFKIFGSSPEAHLVIKNQQAEIHPIAGTFRRTGDDLADAQLAQSLSEDPKENSEHVMLVDLARNDLSRNCRDVQVETYKEIQYFSHVIHLVSKVTGTLKHNHLFKIVADTFPAGTLTGAPKHKAMQLIQHYEPEARNLYGGAIGIIDFQGNFNHAIIIRTFVSQHHVLEYQAGAGIVANSSEELETKEVYHKLNALTQAIQKAQSV